MLSYAGERVKNQVWLQGASTPAKYVTLLNQKFSAAASTDTFTTPAAHGLTAGDLVVIAPLQTSATVLATPASPTLAGITMGVAYFVKTVGSSATFTLSTTSGGATLDVTTDCYGGWMSRRFATLTTAGIVEAITPGSNGVARYQIASGDWTDPGASTTVDSTFTAAKKNFKPTSAGIEFTHTAVCDAATGAATLLWTVPAGGVTTISPPSASYDTQQTSTET